MGQMEEDFVVVKVTGMVTNTVILHMKSPVPQQVVGRHVSDLEVVSLSTGDVMVGKCPVTHVTT
jgi:hypothetical protein